MSLTRTIETPVFVRRHLRRYPTGTVVWVQSHWRKYPA